MFCKNCGSPYNPSLWACERCGAEKDFGCQFCPNCGSETAPDALVCNACGLSLRQPQPQQAQQNYPRVAPPQTKQDYQMPQMQQNAMPPQRMNTPQNYPNPQGYNYNQPMPNADPQQKSKIAAILLALFLGGLGIHNFYLGYTGRAIAQLAIYLVSIPLCFIGIGFATICIPGTWAFVEMILIATGSIDKDGKGLPLKD